MPKINTNINFRRPAVRDIALCALLLLASRASVMGMYPFGITFFAACFDKSIAYIAFFIISLGLVLSSASAYIMKYLVAALLFSFFVHIYKKKSIRTESVICTCSVFLGGAIHSFCFAGGLAGLLLALIEGAVSGIMYVVFVRADEFMLHRTGRTSIARDELISVALTAGVCITGLKGIELPFGITLSGIAAVYTVMCIAYHCNLSAAGSAGLGIGFVCSMSSADCIASGGFYGICALFGSLLKGFGKYGAAVGFLGGAAASLIYAKFSGGLDIIPFDVVLGALAFTATPDKIHGKINYFFTKTLNCEGLDTGERIRMYLSDRLNSISQAFGSLEEVFCSVSDRRIRSFEAQAADLFDETAQRVCRGCSTAVHCWERDWNGTYKRLLTLLDAVEKNEEIPKCVTEQCVRSSAFINEFLHIYEIYRERELFRGEAIISRDLSAQQYRDISGMLRELSGSAQEKIKFRTDYEDSIITELDKRGITLFEISVIELGEGLLEVYLGLNSGAYVDSLEEVINEITGANVEFEGEKEGIAKFVTRPLFSVSTGMCAVPCEGCRVSGDFVDIFDTADHHTYIIISDGMGCGYDARSESEGIIRLLKEFILAGFDASTAIKTVNSALCLQLDKERAAAVDMLCIDRAKGLARMYKIGCAETVIKHGDAYETLFPLSLPAGMLEEINLKPQTRRIHKGDVFIMATDGVTQCGGVFSEWVKKEYSEDIGTEEAAHRIVDKAVTKWNGAAFDDLTTVVVRID